MCSDLKLQIEAEGSAAADGVTVTGQPEQLAGAAAAVFGGLRSLHVALGTAQGQAMAGAGTRGVFAVAMRNRTKIFTAGQATTLEGWVLTSKALREEPPPSSKVSSNARSTKTSIDIVMLITVRLCCRCCASILPQVVQFAVFCASMTLKIRRLH